MKIISKEDLLILIPLINDRNSFSADDFDLLLERFGDDYYIEDGEFRLCVANKEMDAIRQQYYMRKEV